MTEFEAEAEHLAEHLIVFTRYPEAGKTKTRLIPALGAAGAAEVQRQMTLHTLRQVRQWQQQASTIRLASPQVTVQFSGGSLPEMRQWLGLQWNYQPQVAGDLGARLISAVIAAAQSGAQKMAVIGIDCPGVDATCLSQAFALLQQHDVVLGPATDGGYYLIGLRQPVPDLFVGIDWGTDRVRSQTEAIAHSLNLRVGYLDPLTDVDYPDDLGAWEAVRSQQISVIIPVLNEASSIGDRLRELSATPEVEVIVVDGGSQDDTVAVAESFGPNVLHTHPGRAHQMNIGAAAASGGILLFLHADTQLPPQFADWVRAVLAEPGVVAGAFELAVAGQQTGLRWVEWGVKWRSRLLQMPYGDQAIFLRQSEFIAAGGFPQLPMMEDYALVQQLRQRGRVAIAPATVVTSSRRWARLGVLRTTLLNQLIIMGYHLGVSPETLLRWYHRKSRF
ncbi:MAG: TIGR04283 family arsenosugar biosynthesis glycosyltransferase [Kaiparowitsia implicata GSE-PSE-MK54-09C]|jgi:rSAM/selenodomain-associated transferase 2/rSAM/selenodomain-associated transferase 1|nr:TIGR04283 family arsenosugar biosynthesis glycosyltransferase [Kaiparowitsia implicata GSE-PSE-MK54-09C]